MPSTSAEKSGVHLTGADSGWPTGAASEPGYEKPGDGTDDLPHASAVSAGLISDAGTDEVQTVTITGSPTGGTFTLTYAGQTTGAIAYNASAATVQTALESLSNIGVGDVAVSGSAGGPYTVTFGGDLADKDVGQLTSTPSLTGGTAPSVAHATTTTGDPR